MTSPLGITACNIVGDLQVVGQLTSVVTTRAELGQDSLIGSDWVIAGAWLQYVTEYAQHDMR